MTMNLIRVYVPDYLENNLFRKMAKSVNEFSVSKGNCDDYAFVRYEEQCSAKKELKISLFSLKSTMNLLL